MAPTLVIGRFAQAYHLPDAGGSVTDVVGSWRSHWPAVVPLPIRARATTAGSRNPRGPTTRWSRRSGGTSPGCRLRDPRTRQDPAAVGRPPARTLVAAGLVSLRLSIGPRGQPDIAVLCVWILVFVGRFFTTWPPAALTCAVVLTYRLVVAVGPRVTDPCISGSTIVGTGVFAGGVVLVLVQLQPGEAGEDRLTRLAHRWSWDERLAEETGRARRTDGGARPHRPVSPTGT
jgi:hypothetical protein